MATFFDEVKAIVLDRGTKASKIHRLCNELKCTVYEANTFYNQVRGVQLMSQGGQLPPFEIISRCAKRNPDGFGFAVPGRVFKSMSFKRFYKELQSVAKSEVPAVIHFRFATHGSIRLANCHPFRDENTGVSFAHNGVLSLVPDGDMTDSETAFRNVLLPEIENSGINSGKFKTAVSNVIGGSRFAFITDKGNIKMFGNYVRYSDCFYSNLNFI